ncbi:uncharacterized protein LOC134204594, partial [Armigeres subalbatus]|uniref:uncharacterized protein LOC134204594 n=1 Tax=Armigeres subalbatus TaxID=124917 RepID=UPI002ED3DE2F
MAPTTRKASSLKQQKLQLEEITASFDDIGKIHRRKFSEALVELKSHEDFEDEEKYFDKLRKKISELYYEGKSLLKDKAKELHEPANLEQSVRDPAIQGHPDHIRLPQINLQMFNGEIDEWLSFRDLFTSLIHWRTDLPEVEKFHYLKGCLQGEPKGLVDSLKKITRANYQIAWDILCKRYNNNKLLKKKQVQALFKLPTLSRESVTELRTLVEGFDRIVQTLDQIIQPADYKNLLL